MKKIGKILSILFLVLFWFLFFNQSAICDTTVEDTNVSVEIGDKFVYNVKDAFPNQTFSLVEVLGSKLRFTVENISHLGDTLTMDGTVENYFDGLWHINYSNSFYMAANTTLHYLDFGSYLDDSPLFFVIPIPINLTTLAEYILLRSDVEAYYITENTIYTSHFLGSFQLTYNTDGILTKFSVFVLGTPVGAITLSTKEENGIPYGNFYLIFLIISVFTLVYIKCKKSK